MRTDLVDFSFINTDQFKDYNFLSEIQTTDLIKNKCNGIPSLYSNYFSGYIDLFIYINLKDVPYKQFIKSYELQHALSKNYIYNSFSLYGYNYLSDCTTTIYRKIQKEIPVINFSHTFYTYSELIKYYNNIKSILPHALFGYAKHEPSYIKYNIYKIYENKNKDIIFITFYKDKKTNEYNTKFVDKSEIGASKDYFNQKTLNSLLDIFKTSFKNIDKLFTS